MKRLLDFILESVIEYNDKGYSNYFPSIEDFLKALEIDNVIMNKIFKNPQSDEVKSFIEKIYNVAEEIFNGKCKPICDFSYAPLIFSIDGHVKLKRKYNNTPLHELYNSNKNLFKYKFEIGDGSRKGETKGNAYEQIFMQDSIEYITWIINGMPDDYEFKMSQDEQHLFIGTKEQNGLFNKIKINNKELLKYIQDNAHIIDPSNCVKHTGKESTSRNKNGRIIRFEDNAKLSANNPRINFKNLENSGNIIADVQYIFPNINDQHDIINISLKDKDYQLSNLGMSDKTMNIYPFFDEELKSFKDNNFGDFCEYVGIDAETIYNNVHNPKPNTPKEIIDKKYYKNISNLFKIAIGSNYYMVNSTGHVSYIPNIVDENISIKSADVEYPSNSRKRININIKFNDNSKITGQIQLAIRSKSGNNDNYGFAQCQLVWGNVDININNK